jgi:hypothetical protein
VDAELIESNPVSRTEKLIKKKNIKKEVNPFIWDEKTTFEDTTQKYYPKHYPLFMTALRAHTQPPFGLLLPAHEQKFLRLCSPLKKPYPGFPKRFW